jgi:transposase
VLLSSTAICHIIADSRATSVVTAFMDGARPAVWVADRYSGQLGRGAARQMCLAHLLRDAQYAIDEGCAGFAQGFQSLLMRAMAVGKRRDVPYTNNACERALRPSVIFRKMTGGFRAEWGATVYATAATVIATGRLHGLPALQALRAALDGKDVMQADQAGG